MKIDSVQKSLQSLKETIDKLGVMMNENQKIDDLQQKFDSITEMTSTLNDSIQDFILTELNYSDQLKKDIEHKSKLINEKMNGSMDQITIGNRSAEKAREYFESIERTNMVVNGDIGNIIDDLSKVRNKMQDVINVIEKMGKIAEDNEVDAETISASVEEQTANLEEVTASASVLSDLASEMEQSVEKFNT